VIKISLIIPVFNGEDYIEKCLHSCLNQDIKSAEYEVIVVNDGSTDRTLEILQNFKKHSNIKIVNQQNLSLGEARNQGLKCAKGKFVWFIDSDDWIAENCLGNLILTLGECDITRILSTEINYFSVTEEQIKINQNSSISGIEYMKSNFRVCVPFYVFNRNFLVNHELKFMPLIFEDFEFMPRALFFAQKIKTLKQLIYFRLIRPNSIMRTASVNKPYHLIDIIFSLKYFAIKYVNPKKHYIFNRLISVAINNYLNTTLVLDANHQVILNKLMYKNRALFIHLIKSKKFKYVVEGILFYIFPRNTLFIYKTLNYKIIN
jgi:glycosyltransferase involved in cell wall biosynthesis